jgi:hypothetical protein
MFNGITVQVWEYSNAEALGGVTREYNSHDGLVDGWAGQEEECADVCSL